MSLIFTGFDHLTTQAPLHTQLPTGMKLIKPENASLTPDKHDGNALALSDGAFLKYTSQTEISHRNVYVGLRVSCEEVLDGNVVLQLLLSETGSDPIFDHEHSVPGWTFFIKEQSLYLKSDSNVIELAYLRGRTTFYLEVRYRHADTNLSAYMGDIHVYMDGLKIHQTTARQERVRKKLTVSYGYAPSSRLVLDDMYFFEEYSLPGNSFRDDVMPILASGHVRLLVPMETISSSFSVVGESAHTALADADDSTYITTNIPATADVRLDNRVSNIFALNLIVRGQSDANGVVSLSLHDTSGSQLSQEVSIGLTDTATTYDANVDNNNDVDWSNSLAAGATLRVRT